MAVVVDRWIAVSGCRITAYALAPRGSIKGASRLFRYHSQVAITYRLAHPAWLWRAPGRVGEGVFRQTPSIGSGHDVSSSSHPRLP